MDLGNAVLTLTVDDSGMVSGFARAKDLTQKQAAETQIEFDKLGKELSKTGKTLSLAFTAPIVAGFTLAIKGAADEEKSLALLSNAIRGAGLQGSMSAEHIRAFAEGLMTTTTYTHEVTEQAATLLIQLARLDEEGLKAILPRVQNLASALREDLQTAAQQVGKFIDGASDSIGRYSVPVQKGATASERLAAAIAFMDKKFSDAAATAASTASGGLTQLMNSVGELADSFGVILLPIVERLTDWLGGIVRWLSSMDEGTRSTIMTIAALAAAIGPLLIVGGKLMTGISALVGVIQGVGGVMSWAAAGPIGLIILAVAALAFGVYELIKNWDTVSTFFTDLWNKVSAVFQGAVTAITGFARQIYEGVYDWLVGKFKAVVDSIKGAIDDVVGFFKKLYDKVVGKSIVPDLVDKVLAEFKRMQMGVGDWVRLTMDTMVDLIGAGFEAVGEMIVTGADAWEIFKEAAKNAIAGVLEAIGQELLIWGAKALIPMIGLFNPVGAALAFAGAAAAFIAAGVIRALAGGGWVTEPVIGVGLRTGMGYAIAEQGPEYVGPSGPSDVAPAGALVLQAPLIIQIDAKPIYQGMLKATGNRIALIDKRSLVP